MCGALCGRRRDLQARGERKSNRVVAKRIQISSLNVVHLSLELLLWNRYVRMTRTKAA